MLADYAALRAVGRVVRLLIGPWTHGAASTPDIVKCQSALPAVCCVSAIVAVTVVSMLCGAP